MHQEHTLSEKKFEYLENCPFCEAGPRRLELVEEVGHWEHRTYFDEGTFVTDYYIYECSDCGERFATENPIKLNVHTMKIRIDEALAKAKYNGKAVTKKELAAKLWPESSDITQQVNFSNLCAGRTSKINPEWVVIICTELGVSADFLFGLSND